jgi:hypothetical protein
MMEEEERKKKNVRATSITHSVGLLHAFQWYYILFNSTNRILLQNLIITGILSLLAFDLAGWIEIIVQREPKFCSCK